MTWILLALAAALTEGALVVERKRLVFDTPAFELALVQAIMSAAVFAVLLPLTWHSPLAGSTWALIIVRSVCDALAMVLMFSALMRDEASRVMPITALTPLFIVIIEYFWRGKVPTPFGLLGVVGIVLGAFMLLRGAKHETGLRITPGMLPMFLVSILWSVTGVIHTVVTHQIGALLYLGLSQVLILALLLVYGVAGKGMTLRSLRFLPMCKNLSVGLYATLTQSLQMLAQGIAPLASYVVALKRTSLLFGMLGTRFVLKENIERRVVPTLLLTFGAVVVLIFG